MSPNLSGELDDALGARLRAIGWTFDIRLVSDVFMHGVGAPG